VNKKSISQKLQQYQFENQTLPMQHAPVYRKILAFIYQLLGRKLIAKSLVTTSQCDGCKICANVCPNHAISFRLKNPRRNRHCTGCLYCAYSCPKKAFEMPVSSMAGAFLLLFLPYDNWIIKIFSLPVEHVVMSVKYQVISLILWGIGYAIVVFVFEKTVFLLSTMPVFKKLGATPFIKKLRIKIHPGYIFPAIISDRLKD